MSIDHVFIDFDMGKRRPLGAVAVVRTNDRGKVLTAAAREGEIAEIVAAITTATAAYAAPYIIVASQAVEKRASFDSWLKAALWSSPLEGRAWLDFGQVAWPLVLADLVGHRSVEAVADHFKVRRDHGGTLSGDCAILVETYWAMARSYRTAMGLEAKARETVAGFDQTGVVQAIRRMAGF